MTETNNNLESDANQRFQRLQIHDSIYLGSYATKLVAGVDADAHDYVNSFSDQQVDTKTVDLITEMKYGSFEFSDLDKNDLYADAPRIAKEVWFDINEFTEFEEGTVDLDVTGLFKDWLESDATNEQFINIFQSVMYEKSRRAQSPEIVEKMDETIAAYRTAIVDAENSEWLAIGSVERIKTYAENGDLWRWGIASGNMRINATAWALKQKQNEPPQIVFNGGVIGQGKDVILPENAVKAIEDSGFHEFNHAFLGDLKHGWIKEAVTEHIAQVLKGNVDIEGDGYPSGFEHNNPYGSEIKLLISYLGASRHDTANSVTVAEIAKAYSSNNSTDEQLISDKLEASVGISLSEMDKQLANAVKIPGSNNTYSSTSEMVGWHNKDYLEMLADKTASMELKVLMARLNLH